ncbi:dual specificity protein phosphatase 14-like [Penaeus japonicus]|uniref:dual specificity protein phosphatase 14-like n=1 Tax=Penaeus japonicus TaxID=27405 RepID=UPI001C70BE21|nr:dual specificity protein phosphatase 14-like [Penaeus japonicus]
MARGGRWDLGLTQVWAGLWVAPARYVTPEALATRRITSVIWATPEVAPPSMPGSVNLLEIRLRDECDQDLSPFFPKVAEEFAECRARGSGMVTVCLAGISRSSTLAIAALVGQDDLPQMNLRYAYETVKSARPMIRPNIGFFSQLVSYERATRRGEPSVRMVRPPHDPPGRLVPDVYLEELGTQLGGDNPLATFIPL